MRGIRLLAKATLAEVIQRGRSLSLLPKSILRNS
jgi:hypothetical protein